MKNRWFPILMIMPLVTGVCGAILRAAQLTQAFDEETGLLTGGSPLTLGLIAVSVIAAAMAIISAFVLKNGAVKTDREDGSLVTAASIAAALLLLVDAGIMLFEMRAGLEVSMLVFALLQIYCAIALIVLGKYRMAERTSGAYNVFAAVPVFWACFMLILTFRDKISDPIIADYAMLIFSYLCILLFLYALAAHVLGKRRLGVAVFACFLGMYFIIVELISPILAGFMVPGSYGLSSIALHEALPQLAFLIFMPFAASLIVRRGTQK